MAFSFVKILLAKKRALVKQVASLEKQVTLARTELNATEAAIQAAGGPTPSENKRIRHNHLPKELPTPTYKPKFDPNTYNGLNNAVAEAKLRLTSQKIDDNEPIGGRK